nr:GNAT family N-acetyltransferase [Alteromonas sp. C1M14]
MRRYFIPLQNPPLAKSKLRKKATRYYNTFLKQENATVTRPTELHEAMAIFHSLVKLHTRRWRKRQTQTIFDDRDFMAFHQQLIPRLWKSKQLALTQLAVGDEVIAVFYGFLNNKSMYFYQNGINEEFKPNVSPGSIMHLVQAQYALSEGLDEYDFLGSKPGNTYKTRLTPYHAPLFKITVYPSIVRKYREMTVLFLQKLIARFYRNWK